MSAQKIEPRHPSGPKGRPQEGRAGGGTERLPLFGWEDDARHLLWVPVGLVAAALAALPVDCPLASLCLAGYCPGALEDLLRIVEPFGHGLGVLVIVAAIHQLDPTRRSALPRVLVASLGAGLAANGIKMTIVRIRPRDFDFSGTVADTFGDWLPLASAGSRGQSFPSAHTATAVGLAVALVWLYPRGRRLFITLALLVACQRIQCGAHYLSDTLVGAALGFLIAMTCLKGRRAVPWFERLERYLTPRETPA